MRNHRLENRQFIFSVEGETEKWYLEHLQSLINQWVESQQAQAKCFFKVAFDVKIETSPKKRVRSLNIIGKTDIFHFCDYESSDDGHIKQFKRVMDEMKEAERQKQVYYHFGYSNFAFDLWIILHKKPCNEVKSHRGQYIKDLNAAYGKNFEDMNQYKNEANFKSCLNAISLADVKDAIRRAKTIMQNLSRNGATVQKYSGYKYYDENPSLAVHVFIEKILKECGVL